MEQARATASDLPAGQIQAHFFAQMALKANVEAAALDIDNTSSVFPVRFDKRRSDAIQLYDARWLLQLTCSFALVQVFQTRARGQIFRAQRSYEACSHRPTKAKFARIKGRYVTTSTRSTR